MRHSRLATRVGHPPICRINAFRSVRAEAKEMLHDVVRALWVWTSENASSTSCGEYASDKAEFIGNSSLTA
jgi:hypothetical protein